jgi:uncharacterized membrane protein
VLLVIVDFIWLSNAINFLYRPKLGDLLLEKPNMLAAVLFYLLYGIGFMVLVIRPAVASDSVELAAWTGAVFGFVAYGTYDLTNQATLKGWSWTVSAVDMVWGAFMTGLVCAAGVWIARKFA